MQHAIFVSYRREDAPDAAGRVYDRLAAAFGEANVFKDVDTLPVGEDFGQYIASVITRCTATLVLIGPNWALSENDRGRRLEDHSDWVRIEVEAALTTPTTKVIPLLMSGACMPREDQLPESLRPLTRLNAANARRDPDFHQDMSKLISALSTLGGVRPAEGANAATVWSAVRRTEDLEDHRHFIDTFPGTAEAFEARRRVDQLRMLKALRGLQGYLEYLQPEPDDPISPALLLVEGADHFRRRWIDTPWDTEISDLRKVGCQFADELDLHCHDHGQMESEQTRIETETPAQWLSRVDSFFAKPEVGPG